MSRVQKDPQKQNYWYPPQRLAITDQYWRIWLNFEGVGWSAKSFQGKSPNNDPLQPFVNLSNVLMLWTNTTSHLEPQHGLERFILYTPSCKPILLQHDQNQLYKDRKQIYPSSPIIIFIRKQPNSILCLRVSLHNSAILHSKVCCVCHPYKQASLHQAGHPMQSRFNVAPTFLRLLVPVP